MRRLRPFAVCAALIWGAAPAWGGEYLAPESTNFPAYEAAVTGIFKAAYAPDVRARAIVEPSLFLEFAVGVTQSHGAFEVFFLEPSTQVWQAVTSPDHRTDLKAITVKRCSMPIYPDIGERLVAAWASALQDVRPSDGTGGLDGDSYHFSMTLKGHDLAGQTWSPLESSEAGRLASIAYTIRSACKDGKYKLDRIGTILGEIRTRAQ